jgi:hypothetical protein
MEDCDGTEENRGVCRPISVLDRRTFTVTDLFLLKVALPYKYRVRSDKEQPIMRPTYSWLTTI